MPIPVPVNLMFTLHAVYCSLRKALALTVLSAAVCWSPGVLAQTTPDPLAESKAKTLAEFPELGVVNSAFHRAFHEQIGRLRQSNPEFFKDPNWPYTLATRTAQSLAATPASPAGSAAVATAQKSALIAALCTKVIEGKLKSGEIPPNRDEWFSGGKIVRGKMEAALFMAYETVPGFIDRVAEFVGLILKNEAANAPEDRKWVAALLTTPIEKQKKGALNPSMRGEVAATIGIDEAKLVDSLMLEVEELGPTQALLTSPTQKSDPDSCPISDTIRSDILLRASKANFTLGKRHLPKPFCIQELITTLRRLAPNRLRLIDTLSVLDTTAVKDWPDWFLLQAAVPGTPFDPKNADWIKYQLVLKTCADNCKNETYLLANYAMTRNNLLELLIARKVLTTQTENPTPKQRLEALTKELEEIASPGSVKVLSMLPAISASLETWAIR